MGREQGQELLAQWKKDFPELEVIILSGQKDVKLAIECIRLGASDYLVKPMEPEHVLLALERALLKKQVRESFREKPINPLGTFPFVSESHLVKEVLHKAHLLKNRPQLNVLILGESGTGKELLARFIHQLEENPARPFQVANMAAIPANLMEAELFGVEKGAYTDAKSSRAGKFELANGGDIFLDEIGDLPLEMQSKLLRVLQERQVQRLGSSQLKNLSLRVISATHRPLPEMIQQKEFREDLIYRLSDIVLTLPPLRERKEDIPLLVELFVNKHAAGKKISIEPQALDQLRAYSWPGNIRQLESTVKRSLIFLECDRLERFDIIDFQEQPAISKPLSGTHFASQVKNFEKSLITQALNRHHGKKEAAMRDLGLPKATFYRKLHEFCPERIDS